AAPAAARPARPPSWRGRSARRRDSSGAGTAPRSPCRAAGCRARGTAPTSGRGRRAAAGPPGRRGAGGGPRAGARPPRPPRGARGGSGGGAGGGGGGRSVSLMQLSRFGGVQGSGHVPPVRDVGVGQVVEIQVVEGRRGVEVPPVGRHVAGPQVQDRPVGGVDL